MKVGVCVLHSYLALSLVLEESIIMTLTQVKNIHPETSNHTHFYDRHFQTCCVRPEFVGCIFYSGYQMLFLTERKITQCLVFLLCYTQFQIQQPDG